MNLNFLDRKKIVLKVITPFFINSGDDYYITDYVIDNNLKVIDKKRFNERIFKDKKLYVDFLDIADDLTKLNSFFKTNAKEFLYEIEFSKNAKKFLENNKNVNIKKFIRDKFSQTPIIPGSTIKGIIRTALANYFFHNFFYDELKDEKNENKFLNKIFRDGETDAKKDLLKALIINDLKPKNYKLKIIRPFYKIKNDDEPHNLDLLEVLVDGEFEGEIVINKKFLQKEQNLDFGIIKTALKEYYEDILTFETNRIQDEKYKFPNYEEYLVKLGLHSGAGSKTIKDKRDIFIRLSNGKKFYHQSYQLSTWFDESYNALGWGQLILKD